MNPLILLAVLATATGAGVPPNADTVTTDPDGTPATAAMVTSGPTVPQGPTVPLVNLNTATVEQLCTLPGVGRKKAEAIIALRQRRPYTRVTQLLQVKGIGPKTLRRLKPLLVVTLE